MKADDQTAVKPARGLIPPEHLRTIVGSGSVEKYVAIGRAFLATSRRHGRLKPSDRVLDVGCGCGRIARALTRYLASGSYEGFDVVPELVSWCRENITPRYPNFRFTHVDVANAFYHDGGEKRAAQFRFPYPDASFDFAILTSVFTHMLTDDFVRYTGEIARTLKPGGAALMTFFLLNEESLRMKETARGAMKFAHPLPRGLMVEDRNRPEGAVAYPEATVRAVLRANNLVVEQILFGSWCGRPRAVAGQDVIIARRVAPEPAPAVPAKVRIRNLVRRARSWLQR